MSISDNAAEAAARAAYEEEHETTWDQLTDRYKRDLKQHMRAALEAASPYMLAEAWREGAVAGWNQSGEGFNSEYPDESTGECSVDLSGNPYRQG